MKRVKVPVQFNGSVTLDLDDDAMPEERIRALATARVLAQVLATVENPDAPEEDACDTYQEQVGIGVEQAVEDWDAIVAMSVSGTWTLGTGELKIFPHGLGPEGKSS